VFKIVFETKGISACTIKKPIFFLDIFFNPCLIDVDIPFKYCELTTKVIFLLFKAIFLIFLFS